MAKSPLSHAHHIVPTSTYFKTFLALSVLMLATIFAAEVSWPGGVLVNNLIAMAIACLKAFLVIWVFMGIRWATPLARLWAIAGFVVMPLMFIMFQDFFVRSNEVTPSWNGHQETDLPRVLDPVGSSKQVPLNERGFRPR